jgi:hypothetical protein
LSLWETVTVSSLRLQDSLCRESWGPGDALFDFAILTLGHQEHLGDVVAGYGADVDLDVIRAWWSLRSLQAGRWLIEHGIDPSSPGAEFDVLRSQL